jgi:hypothetical protein
MARVSPDRKCRSALRHILFLLSLFICAVVSSPRRRRSSGSQAPMRHLPPSVSNNTRLTKKKTFAKLLAKHKAAARYLDADQQDELRRVISQVSLNTSFWAPPNPATGKESNVFKGRQFTVVLYHLPPFVNIRRWRAVGIQNDPGNMLQTRTRQNGDLSGLTIDLLSEMQQSTGCTFKFVYPCNRKDYYQNGQRCSLPTADEAFTMLIHATVCDSDACPPGFWRAGCRNGHEGACLRCQPCGPGFFRQGCGEMSPGECVPCAAETYAPWHAYRSACLPCRRPCDGSMEIETLACNATQNRECTPVLKQIDASLGEEATCLHCSAHSVTRAQGSCNATAVARAKAQAIATSGENWTVTVVGECVACRACPAGQMTVGCGEEDEGVCQACPLDTFSPPRTENGTAVSSFKPSCQPCWRSGLVRLG